MTKNGTEAKLLLLFYVGNELYACDAEPIIEVVPYVKLKQIPQAPDFVAGLLNYAGQPIPVVDFCQLIIGRPAAKSLHTRIILFNNPNAQDEQLKYLGVIAEKVTETTNLSLSDFVDAGIHVKNLPYLGGVLSAQEEAVQWVKVDVLFKEMMDIAVYSGV